MKEHQAVFPHSPSGKFGRRDLLKMGTMLGLSAPALEKWLLNPGVAFAQSPGLIGYWPFNEGSGFTTQDVSGNSNTGKINGASWIEGRSGQALSFNGSNNSVDINKSVITTSASFTVSAWVLLSDLNNWHTAVSQDGTNVSGFYLQSTHPSVGGQFAFSLVNADSTGTWPTFWNGNVKAITGMARIDGTTYLFLGAPGINQQASMTQTQLEVTPTQSRYVYSAGGVTLYLTFLSPVEATDIQRLSMLFGYIQAQAQSYDGMAHCQPLL